MTRFRAFLEVPGARRLLLSAVVTRMPNGMLTLALLLLVRQRTGSFAVAGVAVGAFALANALTAPLQGRLVDRVGQPPVLAGCAGGQAAILASVVWASHAGAPTAALVALVALAGTLVPPSMACARALWPSICPDSATREAAYALDSIVVESTWVLGPMLVTAAVAIASPAAAVLLCAAITVAGTAVFASAPAARAWRGEGRRPRAGAVASPRLRRLLWSVALVGFWWGALSVGLPALAVGDHAHAAAGPLLALVSAGGVSGGLLYGARSWAAPLERRYGLLLAAMAALLVPLIVVRSLAAAIPLSVLAGLAMTPMISCQNDLVGAAAPAGTITEAFTWAVSAMFAGIAAGSALAGSLVGGAGIGAPFAAATIAAAAAAAIAPAWRRGRIAAPAIGA